VMEDTSAKFQMSKCHRSDAAALLQNMLLSIHSEA